MDVIGRLVGWDALHTQTETAREMVLDHGGDYLFTVKGNQDDLKRRLQKVLPADEAAACVGRGISACDSGGGQKSRIEQKSHATCFAAQFLIWLLACLVPVIDLWAAESDNSSAAALKALAAATTRIVWCQDAGDGTDAGAQGNSLRLMGFDTDDGRSERCILTNLSNYAKPMLTPDGNKIIFSNRQTGQIYIVNWDSSGMRQLASGFALAVWRDALTETDWIYAGTVVNQPDSVIVNIRRFRLDKPEVSEPVWSKTPLNLDNFQLSADGCYASGQFPWPACGVALLPDREWKKFGDGCWPSLSPDNELFWIFDGAHRNLTMFRTKTDERWVVKINNAPGIEGFEVYHPRWSNSALFMVMTGPYKMGTGDNRIRGGGKEVEIYLGKFSADFKKIERWIQVTHNEYADFFPDLWLSKGRAGLPVRPPEDQKNGATGCLALPDRMITEGSKSDSTGVSWPVSYEGLVFFWQNRSKANTFTDPVTHLSCVCRAEAKGRARYGRYFELAPSGGAFIADGGTGELMQKCVASGQLAVEVMITPDTNPDPGVGPHSLCGRKDGGTTPLAWQARLFTTLTAWSRPTCNSTGKTNLLPIIGYAAHPGVWNFLLGQEGRRLVFKLRAGNDKPDYVIALGLLAGDEPIHIIISCLASSVTCYLNGEQTGYHDSIFTRYWQEGSIVFGNELQKEYPVNVENEKTGWQGLIENVALYSRWIGPEEARKKYKASAEKIRNRKKIPVLSAKAKLISRPVIPMPESIAPYRRALAVGQYQIEQITDGTCSNQEVMVAQWVILDAQPLNSAQRRNGKTYRMSLEPFSDHPELEGERLIMDSDRFDLPLYFDTSD